MDDSQQPQQPNESTGPASEPTVVRPQTSPLDSAGEAPSPATPEAPLPAPQSQFPQAQPVETAVPPLGSAPTPQPMAQPAAVAGPSGAPGTVKRSNRLKVLLPVIAGVFLLFGGGVAAYSNFVANSPSGIWKRALKTTAGGFDELVRVSTEGTSKGGKLSGSFKIESPVAVDGNISGQWYDTTSSYTLDVGYSGIRPKLDLRTIPATEGAAPDVYVRLSDLGALESLAGLSDPSVSGLIGQVNNNWFVVDHTLYEQALQGSGDGNQLTDISPEDIKAIGEATSKVLEERLFTDDESKAAVVVDEAIGREDFEGKATYKYRLKVQKDQAKELATALKDALKGTKLNDLVTAGSGKSFEEAIGFDELIESLEDADFSKATAEAWVDMERKFIRNIRITPTDLDEGQSGHIDFYLPYDGGDELPFTLRLVNKDSSSDLNTSLVFNLNKATKASKLSFNVDGNNNGEKVLASGSIEVTPSDDKTEVEKPADARNVYELLSLFLGGGLPAPTNLDDSLYPSLDYVPAVPDDGLDLDDFEVDLN